MDVRTRIVTLGDDRSAGADTAWSWIIQHRWPGWTAEVVTVTHPAAAVERVLAGGSALAPWAPPEPRQGPPACGFTSIKHLTATGDPRRVLGERRQSDLVAIGPRGQGLLKALHLGSTAEWLLRCPSTPVVIARGNARTRRILACVDGSRHADAAVDFLASLPLVVGTEVTVIGVVQWDDGLPDHVATAVGVLRGAGAHVTPLVVEPDRLDLTVNPHRTIFEHMDALTPDLVVLGTSGRTGLARMWVGSVATAVARHSRCSVLMARAQADGDEDGDR